MFARIKKSGRYQYLQLVENNKVSGKVCQRVISTVGRLDQLQAKGNVETLIRSLARFSEKTLLILSGKVDVTAHAVKIGPVLIFERLWKELGLPTIIHGLLADRKFEFDVERAVFLTVLHRLFISGSDRSCDQPRITARCTNQSSSGRAARSSASVRSRAPSTISPQVSRKSARGRALCALNGLSGPVGMTPRVSNASDTVAYSLHSSTSTSRLAVSRGPTPRFRAIACRLRAWWAAAISS